MTFNDKYEWCAKVCRRSPCECSLATKCECCMICFFKGEIHDKTCWVNVTPNEDVYFRFLLLYKKGEKKCPV